MTCPKATTSSSASRLAVPGYLTCVDPTIAADERVFELPPAVAAVLLDPDSGAHLGPLLHMARGLGGRMDRVFDAYRTGQGIPSTVYGDRLRHGIGGLNGPTFDTQLATGLAGLPDVDRTLRSAAARRILDLGYGVGRQSPSHAPTRKPLSGGSISIPPPSPTRRNATAAAGLAHRVTFDCIDAAHLPDDTTYDLAAAADVAVGVMARRAENTAPPGSAGASGQAP